MGTLHANLTLRRLAAIAISKHLWMHSELRDCLKHCSGCYHGHDYAALKKMFVPVVKRVVDDFLIPEPAKEELLFTVQLMGSQMLWTLSMEQNSSDAIKGSAWVEYISWKADGSPNTPEMVRSLYSAGLFESNYFAWEALSACCLEDCINDLWPKMGSIDEYRDWRRHSRRGYKAPRWEFSDYWIARMGNHLQALRDAMQQSAHYFGNFYDGEYSLEENMFIISVLDAQYWAAQYFWDGLNENQRMRTIVKSCEIIRSSGYHWRMDVGSSLSLPTVGRDHLLMFLVQQLSYYGLDEIRIKLLRSGRILHLMSHWPYDDLFMETLREMSIHHDFIEYFLVLYDIFKTITGPNMYLFIDRDVKYHRIFYRIWNANLPNLKSSSNFIFQWGLEHLYEKEEIELLSYILRDEELKDRREEILKGLGKRVGRHGVDSLFYSNFISKVLISEEEREWFQGAIAIP